MVHFDPRRFVCSTLLAIPAYEHHFFVSTSSLTSHHSFTPPPLSPTPHSLYSKISP